MIEPVEGRVAERIARATTRGTFLKRTMGWSFATMAGLAAAGAFPRSARAHTLNGQTHCHNIDQSYVCDPPNGQFCTGCNGHECPAGWSWTSNYGYASACWCTRGGTGATTYYVCCDCASNDGNTSKDCGCYSCYGVCPETPVP